MVEARPVKHAIDPPWRAAGRACFRADRPAGGPDRLGKFPNVIPDEQG